MNPIPSHWVRTSTLLLLGGLAVSACHRSPLERSRDASGGGALNGSGAGNFVIFSDELRSGGGAFLYPGGENQTLSFTDQSASISRRSIRYNWTGGNVTNSGVLQHLFAGFDLMHTALQADYTATPGRDLHAAGYRKATFYARGTLAPDTVLKIEVVDDGDGGRTPPCAVLSTTGDQDDSNPFATPPDGAHCANISNTLTGAWKQFSIPINASTDLNPVKDYFKATFIYKVPFVGSTAAGQGGTIYLDQIQLEP